MDEKGIFFVGHTLGGWNLIRFISMAFKSIEPTNDKIYNIIFFKILII